MRWKTIHSATQRRDKMVFPKYQEEDEWFVMEDIVREVRRRTGRYIAPTKAGKIAK